MTQSESQTSCGNLRLACPRARPPHIPRSASYFAAAGGEYRAMDLSRAQARGRAARGGAPAAAAASQDALSRRSADVSSELRLRLGPMLRVGPAEPTGSFDFTGKFELARAAAAAALELREHARQASRARKRENY